MATRGQKPGPRVSTSVERDISRDEQALDELSRLGYMTTPVTKIDGEVVVGFDQKRLAVLLE